MTVHWKKDFAYAMTVFRLISWPLGIWPLQDYNWFAMIRSIIAFSLQASMILILNMEMYLGETDVEKSIDVMMLIGCGILGIWKLICYRLHATDFICNYTAAVKDYQSIDSEEKRIIMRRHAALARLTCAGLIFFAYFASAVYMATPIFFQNVSEIVNVTEDRFAFEFPLPCTTVLSHFNFSRSVHLLIFLLESAMMLTTCNSNVGNDSLFFNISIHLCGQFELLKVGLSNVNVENGRATEHVKALIKRHLHLIKLAEMLADTISFVLIIQLGVSCVLICISGFQFILALNYRNIVMAVKTCMLIGAFLSQLFAYSYVGDYLSCQMRDIGFSAYSGKWYDYPTSLAKSIAFVMTRAQQPVYLTAGKFFTLNLETYMSIIKTSMSYLSVLRVTIIT